MQRPLVFVAAVSCWVGLFAGLCSPAHADNPSADPKPKDARELLRAGLFEEEANRDLAKAAADYAAVMEQYDAGRTVAATAIFRLAEIRNKQGNKAEATALYQRVVAEFPGDDALTNPSRERLAALGVPAPDAAVAAEPAVLPGASLFGITTEEADELTRARELVKSSPDLLNAVAAEGTHTAGYTPLAYAAEKGWVQAATFLLDHGAKVNGSTTGGEPLHLAALNGHKALVELLLSKGADLNAATPDGWTALHAACFLRRTEITRLLLDKGANPNVVYQEPTHLSSETDHVLPGWGPVTVPKVADNQSLPPRDLLSWNLPVIGTPLLIALFNEDDELLPRLLDHGADPSLPASLSTDSHFEISPLIYVLSHGWQAKAKLLLDRGAKPDFVGGDGVTALHAAAQDAPDLVPLLLDRGATQLPDTGKRQTPLFYAVASLGDYAGTRQNADTTEQPSSPQFESAFKVRRAAWEALLAHGADINARDYQGKTVLFGCLMPGYKPRAMTAFLLAHGADINAADNRKQTPLHQFCEMEGVLLSKQQPLALGFLAWLIEQGADLDAKDADGATPFGAVNRYVNDNSRTQLRLERQFLYPRIIPKLAHERAVTAVVSLLHWAPTRTVSVAPAADYDAPPTLAGFLQRSLTSVSVPNLTVHVHRLQADGTVVEAVNLPLHFDPMPTDVSDWPALRWGDVVTLESDDNQPSDKIAHAFDALLRTLQRTITLQLGDRETTLTLADPATDEAHNHRSHDPAWDATAKVLPPWTLPELVRALTVAEPRARLDAVRIERPDGGQPQAWTVDLRAAAAASPESTAENGPAALAQPVQPRRPLRPESMAESSPAAPGASRAYLASGDRLIIPLRPADDPAALAARRRTICFTVPGRFFTEQVFTLENDSIGAHTLGELIMQAYLDPMIVPYPDFSKVTIHRSKADGGEDHLPVDLLQIIHALGDQFSDQDARRADLTLQWGDVVEVPPTGGFSSNQWQQLNADIRDFLFKALTRDIDTTVNGQKLVGTGPDGVPWGTQLRPVIAWYSHPANNRLSADRAVVDGGVVSQAPFTARNLLAGLKINPDNVVRFSVQVGNQSRDYNAAEIKAIDPWLDLGSKVSIQAAP